MSSTKASSSRSTRLISYKSKGIPLREVFRTRCLQRMREQRYHVASKHRQHQHDDDILDDENIDMMNTSSNGDSVCMNIDADKDVVRSSSSSSFLAPSIIMSELAYMRNELNIHECVDGDDQSGNSLEKRDYNCVDIMLNDDVGIIDDEFDSLIANMHSLTEELLREEQAMVDEYERTMAMEYAQYDSDIRWAEAMSSGATFEDGSTCLCPVCCRGWLRCIRSHVICNGCSLDLDIQHDGNVDMGFIQCRLEKVSMDHSLSGCTTRAAFGVMRLPGGEVEALVMHCDMCKCFDIIM